MNCNKCGSVIRDGARFCPKCGCEVDSYQTGHRIHIRATVILSVFAAVVITSVAALLLLLNRDRGVEDQAGLRSSQQVAIEKIPAVGDQEMDQVMEQDAPASDDANKNEITTPNDEGSAAPEDGEMALVFAPFYGVWCAAYEDRGDADKYADLLKSQGFDACVFLSSEWSNLNSEPYYIVTAGTYTTEADAEAVLRSVHNAGYVKAYVKYSGDYYD